MKLLQPNKGRPATRILLPGLLTVTAIALAWSAAEQPSTAGARERATRSVEPQLGFASDGALLRPTGYRKWLYVGTPLTPNDMNGGQAAFPEFHSVYINPEAYAYFEETGRFADGTVLVKELVSVGTKTATSGKGYFMGDFVGLEVAIKDSARFRDEPGNWAYFSFGHEYPLADRARPQPVANCSTCHRASADDDYVFTQYYPVLRAAKQSPQAK